MAEEEAKKSKRGHSRKRKDGKPNSPRASEAEMQYRADRLFQLIRNGGTRQDCLRFAKQQWDISESSTDRILTRVREMMNRDFDIDRAEFTAQLMQQITSIGMEARRTGQLNIALGACTSLARLAQLEGQ